MKKRLFIPIIFIFCGFIVINYLSTIPVSSNDAHKKSIIAIADKPIIEKLDPPNWWINHSINPVQLLIRGRGLKNAILRVAAPGVTIARQRANDASDHIIAYLTIDPAQAKPGNITLTIENSQGSSDINFNLSALPETTNRYQGFNPDDVIYLIMVDRFADGDVTNNDPAKSAGFYDRSKARGYHGGDLQGIIDRLPYLKDLGVTALWLTPIYDNSDRASDYHGYGAVDFYAVDEHFGDLAKFRELTERAHALGIKIIQDQVMNHTGPDHPWVTATPTPTFLNGTLRQHLNCLFDIPAVTQQNSDVNVVEATIDGWFANILPDLNQKDPETAQYLMQNSLWWIMQTGLDGVRLDTFPYVGRAFWSQLNQALKRQHPQLTVVGEVLHGDPAVVSFFQGGATRFDGIDSNLDTVFDYPSYFVIREFFANDNRTVSEIIRSDSRYPRANILLPFFGNHDQTRLASLPNITPAKQLLAYTYVLTTRGTPQIYYGDEIGMLGENSDPDNRRDFPGGFPGDPRSAFTSEGRTKRERQIFDGVRQLLNLRQTQKALRGGELIFLRDSDRLLTYLRKRDDEQLIIAINNTDQDARWTVQLPDNSFSDGTQFIDLLGRSKRTKLKNNRVNISVKARSAAIFKKSND